MTKSYFTIKPPVIAHRGARSSAPENTLAALGLAKKQGALWLEVDIKLTKDSVPILMHDDRLDRTTNGKGPVAAATWAKIRKLDAGKFFDARFKGERVPCLKDALRFIIKNDMRVNFEIKPCPGRGAETARIALKEIAKAWPPRRVPPLISSFDTEALIAAKQLYPKWPRSFAFETWRDDYADIAAQLGCRAFTIDAGLLDAKHMRRLKKTGLALLAFTVNDAAKARKLLAAGVTAVFSDCPGAIIAAL